MDQAATLKHQKSHRACEAAGWAFQPFVADTYGALRADARGFVTRFIKRYHHKFHPLDEAQAGRAIWSTVSAAVICRAAQQICRMTLADSPLGMPLQALDLHSARTTSSTLPTAPTRPHDMGINLQQPSQDLEAEEELFDFPSTTTHPTSQSDVVMADQSTAISTTATTTTEAASTVMQPKQVVLLRCNNQTLPLYLEAGATLSDLNRQLRGVYHINPHNHTLFLGAQPLQPHPTLAEQGVSDRCEISLHPVPPL